jgi:hypothetical protein
VQIWNDSNVSTYSPEFTLLGGDLNIRVAEMKEIQKKFPAIIDAFEAANGKKCETVKDFTWQMNLNGTVATARFDRILYGKINTIAFPTTPKIYDAANTDYPGYQLIGLEKLVNSEKLGWDYFTASDHLGIVTRFQFPVNVPIFLNSSVDHNNSVNEMIIKKRKVDDIEIVNQNNKNQTSINNINTTSNETMIKRKAVTVIDLLDQTEDETADQEALFTAIALSLQDNPYFTK